MRAIVRAGSLGAIALAAHAAVNARLLRDPAGSQPVDERVSVLVPARDEAARIGACVRALLASRNLPDLEVLVLDDGSADGTAQVIRAAAEGDPRLQVLTGRGLARGWMGKPHACAQLAEAATGSVLVFVDADVVLTPDGVARSVRTLRESGLDLLSPYPRQVADGATARLVQPLLQWSWLTFLPLRAAERSPRPSLTAANGQLLLVDAAAYRGVGGHAAVRAEVVEDVALARVAKRAGLRVGLAEGSEVATCRMYDDARALRAGYGKSLWSAFGGYGGAATTSVLLWGLYVVPPLAATRLLLQRRPREALLPLAGYAGGVAGRVVAARRTSGRTADALTHPLSVLALVGLIADSCRRRARGGLSWRGRSLDDVVRQSAR